mmetsp:Transcript_12932/g.54245  ORF Transcript_12932/g.54245 Transcript_12932/m.54245 type:complete len:200 (-) Transcript_12932:642-1241(-)
MSARVTALTNRRCSYTRTVISSGTGLPSFPSKDVPRWSTAPRITSSSPLGRSILKTRPGGTHAPATRAKSGTHTREVSVRCGSHERGTQGVARVFVVGVRAGRSFPLFFSFGEANLASMPSATSTADLIPSSWNPYPHHAPANHTLFEPCISLIFDCASMAPASNSGCAKVTLCSTVPSFGGRGGLSVTKTSGASFGRF